MKISSIYHSWYHWYEMLWAISCHLYNLKSVEKKPTRGGLLLLVKVTLLHRCFSRVLNCTSGAKFHKASHVMITILAFWDIIPYSLSLIKTHLEIGTPFQGTFNKSKSSRSVQVHLGNEIRWLFSCDMSEIYTGFLW